MSKRRTSLVMMLLACALSACAREDYGFVARLGNDTTSIERITRTRNKIVSDLVQQSPQVLRIHWEAELNRDGSLRRWTMQKSFLNHRPDEPADAEYTADFDNGAVHVKQRVGAEARSYDMSDVLPVTAPWEAFAYGLYELLFEAAARQSADSVPIRQYMTGFGNWAGCGLIRKQPDGTMTLVTGGLSGTGVARVDQRGRMLSYSGARTTYKQEVERVEQVPDIDAIAARFAAREKGAPVRSMSTRDTMRADVGAATIMVDYGRPLRRGRDILGNVVPYDVVWRTGANAATQFSTSAHINVAGIDLTPGMYTLWTMPSRNGALLIVNRQTGQWGTSYNSRMDVGRAPLITQVLAQPVDTFTIAIEPTAANAATLVIRWDRFAWNAPVTVK
jgi:hypothetical protein